MDVLEFTVNGIPRKVLLEEGRIMLSDVLRDFLGLTGTKVGCGAGQCGSCTVVMNGDAVTSCVVPAAKAQGSEVLTIEGLAKEGKLHPIQEAFIEADAIQCGFCTPGLIMRLYSVLTKDPHASEEVLKEAVNKHLCRCTGYETILDAALLAQKKMLNEENA